MTDEEYKTIALDWYGSARAFPPHAQEAMAKARDAVDRMLQASSEHGPRSEQVNSIAAEASRLFTEAGRVLVAKCN